MQQEHRRKAYTAHSYNQGARLAGRVLPQKHLYRVQHVGRYTWLKSHLLRAVFQSGIHEALCGAEVDTLLHGLGGVASARAGECAVAASVIAAANVSPFFRFSHIGEICRCCIDNGLLCASRAMVDSHPWSRLDRVATREFSQRPINILWEDARDLTRHILVGRVEVEIRAFIWSAVGGIAVVNGVLECRDIPTVDLEKR